jgi:hypothetical protein
MHMRVHMHRLSWVEFRALGRIDIPEKVRAQPRNVNVAVRAYFNSGTGR